MKSEPPDPHAVIGPARCSHVVPLDEKCFWCDEIARLAAQLLRDAPIAAAARAWPTKERLQELRTIADTDGLELLAEVDALLAERDQLAADLGVSRREQEIRACEATRTERTACLRACRRIAHLVVDHGLEGAAGACCEAIRARGGVE